MHHQKVGLFVSVFLFVCLFVYLSGHPNPCQENRTLLSDAASEQYLPDILAAPLMLM